MTLKSRRTGGILMTSKPHTGTRGTDAARALWGRGRTRPARKSYKETSKSRILRRSAVEWKSLLVGWWIHSMEWGPMARSRPRHMEQIIKHDYPIFNTSSPVALAAATVRGSYRGHFLFARIPGSRRSGIRRSRVCASSFGFILDRVRLTVSTANSSEKREEPS